MRRKNLRHLSTIITYQPCYLHFNLFTISHEVDKPQLEGRAGVDCVSSAKEPFTRGGRQSAPSGNAHHAGQCATTDLREAKGGIYACEHSCAHAREHHPATTCRTVAYNDLGHLRVPDALEQLAERKQPVEESTTGEVGL